MPIGCSNMSALLVGSGWMLLYFLLCASGALVLRLTVRVPDELFRKLLHMILLGSLGVWVHVFPNWWMTAGTVLAFAVLVYPILCLAERWGRYSETLTERKKGELKASLLQVFAMFALVTAVCWGLCRDRMLVLASVYAWGIGDAVAALVGKRFGRHRIPRIAQSRKSWEGTLAMFTASFFSVLVILLLRGGCGIFWLLLVSFVTAAVSAFAELAASNGHDTVVCPVAAMAVLLPMLWLTGGLIL